MMSTMINNTVLFVDDEKEILRSLQRLVHNEPYQAVFAHGGPAALNRMQQEEVHVLVTDMHMPELDGLELLELVKRRWPDTIRLILSGRADSGSILDAINKGDIYRYITKPWDNRELRIVVRQALELYSLQHERKRLLKRLEQQNRQLERKVEERSRQLLKTRSQAEIGKYASQLVHNLRNPLHSLSSALDFIDYLILNRTSEAQKLEKAVRVAKNSARDLKRIISSILDHAHQDAHFSLEPVDLNRVVRQVLEYYRINPVFNTQVKKEIKLADDLPAILANSSQIKQIVDNLISNAIDAMENSPEKRLTVETSSNRQGVVVRVSDSGCGIEPEHMELIFNSDFTTKPAEKGTGLGLASVKTMVEAYNGSIHVESKKGEGTTFIIQLPIRRSPAA